VAPHREVRRGSKRNVGNARGRVKMDRLRLLACFGCSRAIADMPRYRYPAPQAGRSFAGAKDVWCSDIVGGRQPAHLSLAADCGRSRWRKLVVRAAAKHRRLDLKPSTESAWRESRTLEISRPAAKFAIMRALKAALDPRGILKPGKVFDVHEPEHFGASPRQVTVAANATACDWDAPAYREGGETRARGGSPRRADSHVPECLKPRYFCIRRQPALEYGRSVADNRAVRLSGVAVSRSCVR